MPLKYSNSVIEKVVYNSTDLSQIYYNQTLVFCKPYLDANIDHVEVLLSSLRLFQNSDGVSTQIASGKSALASRNINFQLSGRTVTLSMTNISGYYSVQCLFSYNVILKDGSTIYLYKYASNGMTPVVNNTISNFTYSKSTRYNPEFYVSPTRQTGTGTRDYTISSGSGGWCQLSQHPNAGTQSLSAKYTFNTVKINNISKTLTMRDTIPA